MKIKRLLCVFAALAVLLTVPAWAVEGDIPPEVPEPDVETVPDAAPEEEIPEEIPEEVPGETPEEIPENPPEDKTPDLPPEDDLTASGPDDAGIPDDEDENTPDQMPEDVPELLPAAEPELIRVVVPDSGQVVLNPYRMEVAADAGGSSEQIVHVPQMLENQSSFPVQVSAQVVGTLPPWSDARFVSAPPSDGSADKEIFMYVEFQTGTGGWSGVFGDWANQVLVSDYGYGKDNVLTLDAYGSGWFRLSGAMSPAPASVWTADDRVDVTLSFTFTPAVQTEMLYTPDIGIAPPAENVF